MKVLHHQDSWTTPQFPTCPLEKLSCPGRHLEHHLESELPPGPLITSPNTNNSPNQTLYILHQLHLLGSITHRTRCLFKVTVCVPECICSPAGEPFNTGRCCGSPHLLLSAAAGRTDGAGVVRAQVWRVISSIILMGE